MPVKLAVISQIHRCRALIDTAEHQPSDLWGPAAHRALMECKQLLEDLDYETLVEPKLILEKANAHYNEMIVRVEHLTVNGRWVVEGHAIYYEPLDQNGKPTEQQLVGFLVDQDEAVYLVEIIQRDIPWLRGVMGKLWDATHK